MNAYANPPLTDGAIRTSLSDDNGSFEDEEFDDTGMEFESPSKDIVQSKCSTDDRTNAELTNGPEISERISSLPKTRESRLMFQAKSMTTHRRQPMNSSSNSNYFGYSDEEQRTIIRQNELVSSPRDRPNGFAIRGRQPSHSHVSPSSRLKFNNILDTLASSPSKIKSNNRLEKSSWNTERMPNSEIEGGRDTSPQKASHELIATKWNTSVDSPYRVKVQPTRSIINDEISRDSIIEKVNLTLDSLSTSIRKTKTINPDITSTPKSNSKDIKSAAPSNSLQSEFVDHFLRSPEPTLFKSNSGKNHEFESNTCGSGTWPSDKWLKLRKIVKSRSITRSEAIGSTFLLQELDCSKKELTLRYDFLQQLPKKKSRSKRMSRVEKETLYK
ncbi:predicted protein [Scheffersomyces stipitis CBS 6054]|uniref:Uncharacterized protein n=1 Tax=Scheffersomyces stipitis (strain ATCC 58785 / CBS 6054 / NBRC 10063 / NRRL Y-11545) TaxID=322104 RepID=A3LVD4_PICST|nr:predicted protein [Scheffersomyces stipitis CBS 6054]ABN66762.2 predicted protein [Scheffersomyces stipitis CBS 6054]KAG2734638.1 hypothetical protein G9P44_002644 [Scheffersomyces stipitis]